MAEILWIVNGRTDIAYLHDHGVKYWDPDYKRSGRKDGTLGPVYGAQWRNFNGFDQFRTLIRELKKIHPLVDFCYRRGTLLILLIWYFLLAITVFNYIVMVHT